MEIEKISSCSYNKIKLCVWEYIENDNDNNARFNKLYDEKN